MILLVAIVVPSMVPPVIPALAITTDPVPFALRVKLIFASPPFAAIIGASPIAAFVILISLIANALGLPNTINSLPFASAIYPPSTNLG